MLFRLSKAYLAAVSAVLIFILAIHIFTSSSSSPARSTSSWRDWNWPSYTGGGDPEIVKATPPKFESAGDESAEEGALARLGAEKDDERWLEPTHSAVLPANTAALDATKGGPHDPLPSPGALAKEDAKAERPTKPEMIKQGGTTAKDREDEEKEKQRQKLTEEKLAEMEGQKSLLEKAKDAKPLPALNTTFRVPENPRYSPKGPDPSQVVLVTATDGKGHNGGIEDILGQTSANRRAYCALHGYNYHFVNISQFDLGDAHPVWKKIPAIVDAFNAFPEAQWVFFLDLDAIIMTPGQDLNSLVLSHAGMARSLEFGVAWHGSEWAKLGEYMSRKEDVNFDELDMLIAQDHNGVNAGSFFLRRSWWSQMLLDIWADPFFVGMDWYGKEQDTLLHFIKHHRTFRQRVGLIKQRTANAYPEGNDAMRWQTGDLVVHLAGCWVGNNCQERWQELWGKRQILDASTYG